MANFKEVFGAVKKHFIIINLIGAILLGASSYAGLSKKKAVRNLEVSIRQTNKITQNYVKNYLSDPIIRKEWVDTKKDLKELLRHLEEQTKKIEELKKELKKSETWEMLYKLSTIASLISLLITIIYIIKQKFDVAKIEKEVQNLEKENAILKTDIENKNLTIKDLKKENKKQDNHILKFIKLANHIINKFKLPEQASKADEKLIKEIPKKIKNQANL